MFKRPRLCEHDNAFESSKKGLNGYSSFWLSGSSTGMDAMGSPKGLSRLRSLDWMQGAAQRYAGGS
ncbi:hypothetical protein MPC4_10401 [Methylocella tundrae]|uniref:Uncharacterized protein n=1 Tax=Methylocella tundrae TaxID=227605 RepID=A0A8B6M0U1_METTU|nr:hypothetical protein MPC4_10401 [Methylocella tundrae]